MKYFLIIVGVITIIIIFKNLKKTESNNNKSKVNYNSGYKKLDFILSKAEFNFFNVLSLALLNDEFIICPKVRIADFVKVEDKENWRSKFNKINSKHVDFLICNKKLSPVLAIELDDKSHNNQKERDNFVNELYKSINLPILRIKNEQAYSVIELKTKINELLLTKGEFSSEI